MADVKKVKSPKEFAGAFSILYLSPLLAAYLALRQLTSLWEASLLYVLTFLVKLVHLALDPL
jgi:hypothetical protein